MTNVWVLNRAGRPGLEIQWRDPVTGRLRTRSAKTTVRREAERLAAKVEVELATGRFENLRVTWKDMVEAYRVEKMPTLAKTTNAKTETSAKAFEEIVGPRYLTSITESEVRAFSRELRKRYSSESTIRGYQIEVQKLLRWAKRQGMVQRVPQFELAKTGQSRKSRGLTEDEFAKFRFALLQHVGQIAFPSWDDLAVGLWWGGFRLSEAVGLSWDSGPFRVVWRDRERWFLEIDANSDKKRIRRLCPLAPEFVEFVSKTPIEERTGRLFLPQPKRQHPDEAPILAEHVGKELRAAGKLSGIVTGEPGGKVKHASAHDLRRSFGERWSTRVMPAVLQQLMRHKSIDTTMRSYAGHDAELAAEAIYSAAKCDRA